MVQKTSKPGFSKSKEIAFVTIPGGYRPPPVPGWIPPVPPPPRFAAAAAAAAATAMSDKLAAAAADEMPKKIKMCRLYQCDSI